MNGFLWVIALMMLVMSAILLMGKGSGLIAGYNTSSAEVKSRYDEKKLCRIMGGGLLVLTILFAVLLFLNFQLSNKIIEYTFIGIMAVDILMMLVLGNTACRKK